MGGNQVRRGVFGDVGELIIAMGANIAISACVGQYNRNPKAFIRTAGAAGVLEKVKRARRVLDKARSA